jgi:CTP synthase
MKTKPTQQSVALQREIGIQPDILICRTEQPMTREMGQKISLFCNVRAEAVIEERDVDFSIYELPTNLVAAGLDKLIVERLGLPASSETSFDDWRAMLEDIRTTTDQVEIAIVGKYVELHDAYKSIYEALSHAGIANHCRVKLRKVRAEDVLGPAGLALLDGCHGILVPGGFGDRGIEGKILAIRHARERGIPFFGICLGMQCAVIEYARNALGLEGAHTLEHSPHTPHPVIAPMAEQRGLANLGGTMRLGAQPCRIATGSLAHRLYGQTLVQERHRHRYEFNNDYRDLFQASRMRLSGINPERDLVEIVELTDHPFFIGVQFHPEFRTTPLAPHPIFRGFVAAALSRSRNGNRERAREAKLA